MRAWLLAAVWLLAAGAALAQPWSAPDLSRRPAIIGHDVDNFDIAISEVCFPYLLLNADEASWQEPNRTGILRRSNAGAPFEGKSAYFAGRHVTVGVRQTGEGRECMVMAERG